MLEFEDTYFLGIFFFRTQICLSENFIPFVFNSGAFDLPCQRPNNFQLAIELNRLSLLGQLTSLIQKGLYKKFPPVEVVVGGVLSNSKKLFVYHIKNLHPEFVLFVAFHHGTVLYLY